MKKVKFSIFTFRAIIMIIFAILMSIFFFNYYLYIAEKKEVLTITYFDNLYFSLGVGWLIIALLGIYFRFIKGCDENVDPNKVWEKYPLIVGVVVRFFTGFVTGFIAVGTALFAIMLVIFLGFQAIAYIIMSIFEG